MVGYPGFGHPGQYLNGGGTQVRTGKYVHDPQTDGRRKGREYLALLGQNVLRRKTPDDLIDPPARSTIPPTSSGTSGLSSNVSEPHMFSDIWQGIDFKNI